MSALFYENSICLTQSYLPYLTGTDQTTTHLTKTYLPNLNTPHLT